MPLRNMTAYTASKYALAGKPVHAAPAGIPSIAALTLKWRDADKGAKAASEFVWHQAYACV